MTNTKLVKLQDDGVKVTETYAPVIRSVSIILTLELAVQYKYKLLVHQIDISTAFKILGLETEEIDLWTKTIRTTMIQAKFK